MHCRRLNPTPTARPFRPCQRSVGVGEGQKEKRAEACKDPFPAAPRPLLTIKRLYPSNPLAAPPASSTAPLDGPRLIPDS